MLNKPEEALVLTAYVRIKGQKKDYGFIALEKNNGLGGYLVNE